MPPRPEGAAEAGWLAAIELGAKAERAESRAALRSVHSSVFTDWARDAAEAFGDAAASECTHSIFAAIVQGIRILDDIQDGEAQCLAIEVGVPRAIEIAVAALARALELTAELPVTEWRAAARAVGRGIRETAIGQQLEATADSYWTRVDRKTAPLVATALELGALAAGADPARAAALTRLAIPLGRMLQIGDDCNDALGDNASDWRTPHFNLLMSYSLAGPNGDAFRDLLRREAFEDGKVFLLRDGALAYAIHAQLATLDEIAETVRELALPHPEPFLRTVDQGRADVESLLRRT